MMRSLEAERAADTRERKPRTAGLGSTTFETRMRREVAIAQEVWQNILKFEGEAVAYKGKSLAERMVARKARNSNVGRRAVTSQIQAALSQEGANVAPANESEKEAKMSNCTARMEDIRMKEAQTRGESKVREIAVKLTMA